MEEKKSNKIFRIILVGGNWDNQGGRRSSYVAKLAYALAESHVAAVVYNGGYFSELPSILESNTAKSGDAIVWMANVPNDLPKQRGVKEVHPHILFVATKRNNDEYRFQELLNRALSMKANLCIDFRRNEQSRIAGRIYDPLGVVWRDYTEDIALLAKALVERLRRLGSFTRHPTVQIDSIALSVPQETQFFEQVRRYADIFHQLIEPAQGVTRFLGNSSFRCTRGFPSMRGSDDPDQIFMSRRNVDKRFIDASAFVAVKLDGVRVLYWGLNKPSVDTPIQLRLYQALPNINYMMHGHVYLENAPKTAHAVPCGAVEEVQEILDLLPHRDTKFAYVNLLGHGCLMMVQDPRMLEGLSLVSRPAPEYLS